MSDLIKRFKEDLQLAGYAKRSIDSYVSSVLRLQRFLQQTIRRYQRKATASILALLSK